FEFRGFVAELRATATSVCLSRFRDLASLRPCRLLPAQARLAGPNRPTSGDRIVPSECHRLDRETKNRSSETAASPALLEEAPVEPGSIFRESPRTVARRCEETAAPQEH